MLKRTFILLTLLCIGIHMCATCAKPPETEVREEQIEAFNEKAPWIFLATKLLLTEKHPSSMCKFLGFIGSLVAAIPGLWCTRVTWLEGISKLLEALSVTTSSPAHLDQWRNVIVPRSANTLQGVCVGIPLLFIMPYCIYKAIVESTDEDYSSPAYYAAFEDFVYNWPTLKQYAPKEIYTIFEKIHTDAMLVPATTQASPVYDDFFDDYDESYNYQPEDSSINEYLLEIMPKTLATVKKLVAENIKPENVGLDPLVKWPLIGALFVSLGFGASCAIELTR